MSVEEFTRTAWQFALDGTAFLRGGKKRGKIGGKVDQNLVRGVKVCEQRRAEFAATAPAAPGLVRDDLDRPDDTRFDRKKDPSGLEGPKGERKKVR